MNKVKIWFSIALHFTINKIKYDSMMAKRRREEILRILLKSSCFVFEAKRR